MWVRPLGNRAFNSSSKKIEKANKINQTQMVKCIWNLISDVYRSFSACYTFKSCIYNFYPASVFIFQPSCRKGWVLLLLPKTYKVLDAKLVLFCRQGRLERSGERRKVISTTEGRGPSSTTLSSSGVGAIHPLTFTSAFSMLHGR